MIFPQAPVISNFTEIDAYVGKDAYNTYRWPYCSYVHHLPGKIRWTDSIILITENIADDDMPDFLLEHGSIKVASDAIEWTSEDGILATERVNLPDTYTEIFTTTGSTEKIRNWQYEDLPLHDAFTAFDLHNRAQFYAGARNPVPTIPFGVHTVQAAYVRDLADALPSDERIRIRLHPDSIAVQFEWNNGIAQITSFDT